MGGWMGIVYLGYLSYLVAVNLMISVIVHALCIQCILSLFTSVSVIGHDFILCSAPTWTPFTSTVNSTP